jgi:hypothetical protein
MDTNEYQAGSGAHGVTRPTFRSEVFGAFRSFLEVFGAFRRAPYLQCSMLGMGRFRVVADHMLPGGGTPPELAAGTAALQLGRDESARQESNGGVGDLVRGRERGRGRLTTNMKNYETNPIVIFRFAYEYRGFLRYQAEAEKKRTQFSQSTVHSRSQSGWVKVGKGLKTFFVKGTTNGH